MHSTRAPTARTSRRMQRPREREPTHVSSPSHLFRWLMRFCHFRERGRITDRTGNPNTSRAFSPVKLQLQHRTGGALDFPIPVWCLPPRSRAPQPDVPVLTGACSCIPLLSTTLYFGLMEDMAKSKSSKVIGPPDGDAVVVTVVDADKGKDEFPPPPLIDVRGAAVGSSRARF